MVFISEVTLDDLKCIEHTRVIDIVDIESFDKLDPTVQILSGLSTTDEAIKKE